MAEQEKKTFYITTPIYYPSDKLHIGHSYTTVAADAIARYKRMTGYDVYFLTGSDEHGQKIERKAKAKGITPKQYVDEIVASFKDLWKLMCISNDGFVRTTDDYHVKAVQKIFRKLYEQGDIYKSAYEGWYCTPCESFWLERQLKDGCCPDCGRPVEKVKEESYFFKMSKYAPRLIQYIKDHPDFIQPPARTNEMLNNFLLPGLEDLCVSRTSFTWGIPVDFDEKHVVYVWLDALSNYITKLGYGSDDDSLYKKYWPADVHLVGKEIVRFHTIIWPIMLMALGEPLPKQVFGHGWLILEGGKMSKSKGNVVDPVKLCNRYGVDAIRYFLLREVPFGSDGVFSNEALIYRINSDLANDLGNLLSRTVSMIDKYFGGVVENKNVVEDVDNDLKSVVLATKNSVQTKMDQLRVADAISEIFTLFKRCNKYIDETMPWALAKDEAKADRLSTVLYNLVESITIGAALLTPFMPDTAEKIVAQLGTTLRAYDTLDTFGVYPNGGKVTDKPEILFARIDPKEMSEKIAAVEAKYAPKEEPKKEIEGLAQINIEDFAKVELRAAKVVACEPIKRAKKLLKLTLDDGTSTPRTVASGIAKWYKPEDLIGHTVIVVANLKPAVLCGVESQGMILAADAGEDDVRVVFVDGTPAGSKIR